ncbi:cytoplasmic dynein 1 light intermediate chain 1 isoform X2 [Tympanuchus pallidicinctus]|uniref:cytoplasmic dynein 1 light intermediate chain 1 isoform X1 n=1 Tax=Lagopus muta TaxID=64668 RepID=UPI0020A1A0C7|nr:cytoplasmic dynein 1 light intermediate chain 1 isoform X1 [Lagopus muta]XP_052551881.1 cytoplasmic dynein 1 light intermediate chain 1 isoform X2 [Tympanuchus pallidicinctus]
MAAVGRAGSFGSSSASGAANNAGAELRAGGEEDDGQNLWSCILSEVSTRSRSKLPSGKSVLLLGEDGAGKTSLIGKIQGIEEYKKGRGMEYLYLNVHDEDRDDQTRCNVRILDGDLYHKGLLKFAMESNSLKDTLVMLVVDMSRPWTAMDSLQKWASVVREHIDKLKIPPEEMKEMEQKLVRDFQEYVEPGEDFPASPQRRNTSLQEDKDDSVILPLGADTLTCNLGIPVVVVCTKCDAIGVLEKEHDYRDEHFDFIQSHIRRFCLQYGAALIYTSVKENKNIDLVYKYIVQKLYGFPFNVPAVVVEKDAVFIPAGWDNDKKIGILHENFQTLKAEDSFEDTIRKPPVRKFVHEKEIVAEDDQVFLMKQQSQLAKQPPTAAGRPVDASPRVPGGSPRTPNRSVTSNVASVTPIPAGSKKIDPNMKAGATSEGVLANFFNSLLSKKTGSPGGPGGVGGSPGGGSTGGTGSNLPPSAKKSGQKPVLTDVQAELDRISRKPEMVSPTSPTSPTEGEAS